MALSDGAHVRTLWARAGLPSDGSVDLGKRRKFGWEGNNHLNLVASLSCTRAVVTNTLRSLTIHSATGTILTQHHNRVVFSRLSSNSTLGLETQKNSIKTIQFQVVSCPLRLRFLKNWPNYFRMVCENFDWLYGRVAWWHLVDLVLPPDVNHIQHDHAVGHFVHHHLYDGLR